MSLYQPGVPTGTVNLNQDYLNIKNNFTQADTSFGVDHVPFSNATAQNGYHESIHLNPVSTTVTNPPNNQPLSHVSVPPSLPPVTPGFGQIFSAQINDGITTDEALYFLSGGDRLTQLTRNFQPVALSDGYTFIPGGLIVQWGTVAKTGVTTNKSFNISFPANCFVVHVTPNVNAINSTQQFSVASKSTAGFVLGTNTGYAVGASFFWVAIGN